VAVLKSLLDADGRVKLNAEELRQKILLETAPMDWPELARWFARGVVVIARPGLDLVEVAASLAENDQARLQDWIESGQVRRALDADAKRWNAAKQRFWAVVVAPWVLVQEFAGGADQE
jgi:hypothetical protein